jgi:hypothetical protein
MTMNAFKTFEKKQRKRETPFYILNKAIPVYQRADTLLGVAFANPRTDVYDGIGFTFQRLLFIRKQMLLWKKKLQVRHQNPTLLLEANS